MVEVTGLEPAASWSQTKHSTKLSYTSKLFNFCRLNKSASLLYNIKFDLSTIIFNFFETFMIFIFL